jgi:hypothetical protein
MKNPSGTRGLAAYKQETYWAVASKANCPTPNLRAKRDEAGAT